MNQTAANDNNNRSTLQSEQLRLALFLKKNNSMILMLIPVIAWLLWHDIAHLYILLWLSSMVLLVIIRHQLTPTHIDEMSAANIQKYLARIHSSEPTRLRRSADADDCVKKKKKQKEKRSKGKTQRKNTSQQKHEQTNNHKNNNKRNNRN